MTSYTYEQVIVTPVLMLTLSLVSLLLRCWVKRVMLHNVSHDDWLLVLSFVLFCVLCTLSIISAGYGFGKHSDVLEKHNLFIIYRLWFFEEIVYLTATITLKLSIAILLLRLAVERAHRIIIYSTSIFYTVTGIAFIFGVIFQCWPIRSFWTDNDERSGVDGTCVSAYVLGILAYSNATISLVSDLIFVAVPISFVWSLNLERRTKFSVSIVLCLGFMASAVNMARYNYIDNLASPGDNSYDYAVISLVSILEIGLGIIAASLATCRPLIRILTTWIPFLRSDKSQPRTTNERALHDATSTHTHCADPQSHPLVNTEKPPPMPMSTLRSREELEVDVRDWQHTCRRAQRSSAVIHLAVDMTRTLSESSSLVVPEEFQA
ncbi:integral membrane protein [Phlyctema vagabunda]|uniref:Integral membrane protein n=1 Tax=Phlyctema vagabunda TaxID=108571 RepID=A0ABR4PG88_9HELO